MARDATARASREHDRQIASIERRRPLQAAPLPSVDWCRELAGGVGLAVHTLGDRRFLLIQRGADRVLVPLAALSGLSLAALDALEVAS